MNQDDLDHIPSIVPTRDTEPHVAVSTKASAGRRRGSAPPVAPKSGGTGSAVKFFVTLTLLGLGLACAWIWQLQGQLAQASKQIAVDAGRIADLEARLSDTDEGMTQNAAVQAVKISELEAEVRKLWDNVWKQSKQRLEQLEAASASQGKALDTAESSLAKAKAELESAAADIAKLKTVAGDMSRLMDSARAGQAEVERVADALNRIDLEMAKLNKRVERNEEWVESVNAFRKQVNASLLELQNAVNALRAP